MRFRTITVTQGKHRFYMFTCKASELWKFSKINQRLEDKDQGYQRVLSPSRVKQIREFLMQGNAIPGSIIISCENARVERGILSIPDREDAAWIIDGQHRCAGADQAAKGGVDVNLPIVAFLDLTEQQQADYFVTINKEAKGVPSSLYIDLLRHLPKKKSEKERLEERIADISKELTRQYDSVFFQRVVSTTGPKVGQVSLTNFARRLRPILHPTTGILGTHTLVEQMKIIENYFLGISTAFPEEFNRHLFFRTLGFGAVWRAFPVVFSASLREAGGFRPNDVAHILGKIVHFDFSAWAKMGTGAAAEVQAGDDLSAELNRALDTDDGSAFSIRL